MTATGPLALKWLLFQENLPNMTWHEVQARLIEVQKEEQMCIHQKELTQLGLYRTVLAIYISFFCFTNNLKLVFNDKY